MVHFGKFCFGSATFFQKLKIVNFRRCKRTFIFSKTLCVEYQTMQNIRDMLNDILQTDSNYTTEPKSREHLLKFLPSSQNELPVRKMKDSFDSVVVPLSSDMELRDKYTTFLGSVRLGRLMEDIDMFAGYIAYEDILFPKIPSNAASSVIIITVSVCQIDVLDS